MKVILVSVIFWTLLLEAKSYNDDEMKAKMEAMEKRLTKMTTMEKQHLTKMAAMEKQHLAKMDAMEKQQLVKMDAMEKRQEIMEKREEVTEKRLAKMDAMEKRLAAVEQQEGKGTLDSTSFFSAQFSQDTEVAHGGTAVFDLVVVNYGSDYIQSGGTYL